MSAENRKANRVCELKQITVLILIFLLSSVLAVVVGSDLSSAADNENETITADFTASPASGEAPLTVQFTDTSTGSPTAWSWDFGDGTTSPDQNPIHTYTSAGAYTVTLTASNANGPDSKNVQINVLKSTPTITWSKPADITSGTALSSTQLNAVAKDPESGATVDGTFVYNPAAGTILPVGTHPLHVDFTPSDPATYTIASADVTINVLKSTPTITWSKPADITSGTALSSTQLNAVASVPGTFVYNPAAGTILPVGTHPLHVDFTPSDPATYTTASADVTINVLKSTPTITWSKPADITSGTALSSTQLNAVASVPGTFVYNPAAGTILPVGTHPLHVDFTPSDPATYTIASADVTINVLKSTPTITWSKPADITSGTALSSTQLNAVASVPGTFVYNPAAGTILPVGTHSLHVDFTPSDPATYTIASADVTINVIINVIAAPLTPTITWSKPADITSGTALSSTQLNAVASVPGSFVYTPAEGTVLSAGTQTLKVDFTPTNTANYNTASQNVTINVLPPVQNNTPEDPSSVNVPSINAPTPDFTSNITYGKAPLIVGFEDLSSGGPTAWEWDFNSDGTIDSTEQKPVYEFKDNGFYTVTLRAGNGTAWGNITKSNYITVGEEEDNSGSRSSSVTSLVSGGGGGGSPEPASNIEVKELAQEFVTNVGPMKFEFAKNATPIMYVKFDSKRNFGRTTATVEHLKGRSVLTPKDPSGIVHRYLNIWVGTEGVATPENIANAVIGFRVNRAEITENATDGPSVFMYRYSGGEWIALPTRKTGEDGHYMYFEARTPGFSSFAIITGKNAVEYKEGEPEESTGPLEPSIGSRQEMPETASKPLQVAEDKDWSGTSVVIKVLVGFMVILLIGLAVKEKINDQTKF